jgi:hypothetical protein
VNGRPAECFYRRQPWATPVASRLLNSRVCLCRTWSNEFS